MAIRALIDTLARRAPMIVILTLAISLAGAWTNAPDRLFIALAICVGSLAIVLFATRGLRHQFKSREGLGFTRNRDMFAYVIAGKGVPRGYYLLGILGGLTIFIVGFQSPYGVLAFAGFMLSVAWGITNARYPSDCSESYVRLPPIARDRDR